MSLGHHQHSHTHIENKLAHDILHNKKSIRILDKLVMVVGILGPCMTLPQVWQIWSTKNVGGLNLSTWVAWEIFTFFWLAYAFAHKDRVLLVNNSIWVFLHLSVIIGIVLYR